MNNRRTGDGNVAGDDTDELVDAFARYLRSERALAATTVENYLNQVRPFAAWWGQQGRGAVSRVTIGDVNRFLTWRSRSCSSGSMTVVATALRAWLRWLFLVGALDQQLDQGVGPVRYSGLSGVPKALSTTELRALLEVEASPRDRALALLLARVGLRSAEAAALSLEDVDWRAGTVRIRGKGQDHQLMPLPAEVGEALVVYLRDQRRGPEGPVACRRVFLAVTPPYGPLTRNGVSNVVTRLARRAGIERRVGAHRLRHSAATGVLAAGGTLGEAGQLLRHRSAGATAIYAKVDEQALAALIRPWPTGDGR